MKSSWYHARPVSLLFLLIMVAGCSAVRVGDYEGMRPLLTPEGFFTGEMTAHGVVKDRGGRVIRYFNAAIRGYMQEGSVILEEDFVFDDGEKQRRVWTLRKKSDGTYSGTAGDVVGEARGEVAGNSMFLNYVLRIPYRGDTLDVTIDDRMYLTEPGVLVNESKMYKFAFRVGEILLVIVKEKPPEG